MTLAFLAWEIHDNYPLINPSHDGVVILITNLLNYLFFNLIAQHILFCKRSWNHKNNKKKSTESPPPFPLKCCTPIVQNNSSHAHQKEREEKLESEPPYTC
jgi:hypothetical protein